MFLCKIYCLWVIIVLGTLICSFEGCARSYRKAAVESWETANGYFKVRVVAFEEGLRLRGLPGTFYVFSSSLAKENTWKEIMVFRHDDRPLIPRNNIRFVSDQIGYIFMESMYAVTTDAGETWSVWDATKDAPDRSGYKYGFIKDIQLSPDGNGIMTTQGSDDRSRKDIINMQLRTSDFGRHWDRNQ